MILQGDLIQTIADVGSTLIIIFCSFLKVPQILKIIEKKSADGIYLQAMIMEVTQYTIVTLYNYTRRHRLITYLEYPFLLLQVYTMFYFVLKYKKMLHQPIVTISIAVYYSLIVAFMMGLLPKILFSYLIPICPPLSGITKVTYMYGIIKAANADAVSLTTWIISVTANCARIFTVYLDSADWKLMANFIISTSLGSGVLLSAIYYKCQSAARLQKLADKKRIHQE
ncbi:solute carrier family 66 member 3-like [Aphomia sociella]